MYTTITEKSAILRCRLSALGLSQEEARLVARRIIVKFIAAPTDDKAVEIVLMEPGIPKSFTALAKSYGDRLSRMAIETMREKDIYSEYIASGDVPTQIAVGTLGVWAVDSQNGAFNGGALGKPTYHAHHDTPMWNFEWRAHYKADGKVILHDGAKDAAVIGVAQAELVEGFKLAIERFLE